MDAPDQTPASSLLNETFKQFTLDELENILKKHPNATLQERYQFFKRYDSEKTFGCENFPVDAEISNLDEQNIDEQQVALYWAVIQLKDCIVWANLAASTCGLNHVSPSPDSNITSLDETVFRSVSAFEIKKQPINKTNLLEIVQSCQTLFDKIKSFFAFIDSGYESDKNSFTFWILCNNKNNLKNKNDLFEACSQSIKELLALESGSSLAPSSSSSSLLDDPKEKTEENDSPQANPARKTGPDSDSTHHCKNTSSSTDESSSASKKGLSTGQWIFLIVAVLALAALATLLALHFSSSSLALKV